MTQTVALTKLTKLTKKAKKQFIREALFTGIFDRDNIRQILHVSDRTVRRYLNEIAQEEALQNPEKLHVLRALCLANLLSKATKKKLADKLQVAIVLAGEAKRIEAKSEFIETQRVLHLHMWKPELDAES